MLQKEIQNIYILMREKSRAYPQDSATFTSSTIKQEDEEIRKMDIFQIIDYIRAAIDIILEPGESESKLTRG